MGTGGWCISRSGWSSFRRDYNKLTVVVMNLERNRHQFTASGTIMSARLIPATRSQSAICCHRIIIMLKSWLSATAAKGVEEEATIHINNNLGIIHSDINRHCIITRWEGWLIELKSDGVNMTTLQ